MSASVYIKVRDKVEHRLNRAPRWAIRHALLFTAFSVPVGLWSLATHTAIDGVVYWTIFLWSILLLGHSIFAYVRSGAWERNREYCIQQELLTAGSEYALTDDEMIDLHLRLAAEIQTRSQRFKGIVMNGFSNFLLWPGVLVLLLIVQRLNFLTADMLVSTFKSTLTAALIGTLFVGLFLPFREIRHRQEHKLAVLRSVYAKRKNDSTFDQNDNIDTAQVGDDGELTWHDETQNAKRKR